MMTGFTHYSLFHVTNGCKTIAEFAPLPEGGLFEIVADLHNRLEGGRMCLSISDGALHPNGEQMSFGIGRNMKPEYQLILMTRDSVAGHAVELRHEGNHASARLAAKALKH